MSTIPDRFKELRSNSVASKYKKGKENGFLQRDETEKETWSLQPLRMFASVVVDTCPGNNKHSHSRVTFRVDSFTPLGLALSARQAAGLQKMECFRFTVCTKNEGHF